MELAARISYRILCLHQIQVLDDGTDETKSCPCYQSTSRTLRLSNMECLSECTMMKHRKRTLVAFFCWAILHCHLGILEWLKTHLAKNLRLPTHRTNQWRSRYFAMSFSLGTHRGLQKVEFDILDHLRLALGHLGIGQGMDLATQCKCLESTKQHRTL